MFKLESVLNFSGRLYALLVSKMEGVCEQCFGERDRLCSFDGSGFTPLLRATDNGHLECMEGLIKAGADVNKPKNSEDNETPLMKAVKGGHVKCIELLLKSGADVNLWTTNKKGNKNFTALMKAAEYGHDECLKVFVEAGANVNAKNAGGQTALYFAAANKKAECVELLTNAVADVNIRCNDKYNDSTTPLIAAITDGGNYRCVEVLVNAGADVNIVDKNGDTPLICASEQSSTELVELILKAGADVNAANKRKSTALHKAVANGNGQTARFLIQAGADVNLESDRGVVITALQGMDDEEHMKTICALLETGASVNAQHYHSGKTPLIFAVWAGNVKSAMFLLQRGADVNAEDCWNNTALHTAITCDHTN